MNIGQYTFEEFKDIAGNFHGFPAPGLLLGGYMVELAKSRMADDILYAAIVETGKSLPDAVQLLTVLSIGNGRMRVVNLGRYALSLFDTFTGEGWRVSLDSEKIEDWPHIKAWLLKLTPKKEQDTEALYREIEQAGHTVCSAQPVQVHERFLSGAKMGRISRCPVCREYYPDRDGPVCRGCQGDAPYASPSALRHSGEHRAQLQAVPLSQAVGKTALHDMTRIVPGESKGPFVSAGQVITAGDLCRLQQMGRSQVYVHEAISTQSGFVHENEAALAFAGLMSGPGMAFSSQPREGKVSFSPVQDGLLVVDNDLLTTFNSIPGVMCATRQSDIFVEKGRPVAGARALPLYLPHDVFSRATAVLERGWLLKLMPLHRLGVGVLVTGSEVFQGLIEDRFAPLVRGKVEHFGSTVVAEEVVPDDRRAISDAVARLLEAGTELIVTTAGLSVDPDDVTRQGLVDAGITDMLYGAPVLPGAMTLLGRIHDVRVIGVPACALFHKTTSFDLLLPRILAGRDISRCDLTSLAMGGFCLACNTCTFPKCPFGK